MQRSRILLLAVALSVFGVAACGGGGGDDRAGDDAAPKAADVKDVKKTSAEPDAGGGGTGITVTAKEFSFEPAELTLEAGKATAMVLENGGAVEHDITIDSPAFQVKALPTKTAEAELTIPAAGSYSFYCSIPGHRQAGMEGTVTVS